MVGAKVGWALVAAAIFICVRTLPSLYLQSSLDEVFNPRLRRGKKKNLAKAAAAREEAARKLAEQNKRVEVQA